MVTISKVKGLNFTSLTTSALLNAHPSRRLRDDNSKFLRTFPIFDPARSDIRGNIYLGAKADEETPFTIPLILFQSVLFVKGTKRDAISWNPSPQTYAKGVGMDIVPRAMALARIMKSLRLFQPIWDATVGHETLIPWEEWGVGKMSTSVFNDKCWESLSNPRGGFSKPVVRSKGLDMGMDSALIKLAYSMEMEEDKVEIGQRICGNRHCINPWHSFGAKTTESISNIIEPRMEYLIKAAGRTAFDIWYEMGKPKLPLPIATGMGFAYSASWDLWEDFTFTLLRERNSTQESTQESAPQAMSEVELESHSASQAVSEVEPSNGEMTEDEARTIVSKMEGEAKDISSVIIRHRLTNRMKLPNNRELVLLVEEKMSKLLFAADTPRRPIDLKQNVDLKPLDLKPFDLGNLMKITPNDLPEE